MDDCIPSLNVKARGSSASVYRCGVGFEFEDIPEGLQSYNLNDRSHWMSPRLWSHPNVHSIHAATNPDTTIYSLGRREKELDDRCYEVIVFAIGDQISLNVAPPSPIWALRANAALAKSKLIGPGSTATSMSPARHWPSKMSRVVSV